MPWTSNPKHEIEEKSAKSSRSSSKVVSLGLAAGPVGISNTVCDPVKDPSGAGQVRSNYVI